MKYLILFGVFGLIMWIVNGYTTEKREKREAKERETNAAHLSILQDEEAELIKKLEELEKKELSKEDDSGKQFCAEVRELAAKYDKSFFFVTEGASACVNNGSKVVRDVREAYIDWQRKNRDVKADDYEEVEGI